MKNKGWIWGWMAGAFLFGAGSCALVSSSNSEARVQEGVIAREECESFCEAAGSYLVAIEYDLTSESAQCVCALPDQE